MSADRPLRVLVWHVHGAWTTSFVHGPHTYFIPTLPDRGPNGLGRAETYEWPENAVEIAPDEARDAEIDAVILQRPEELDHLCEQWTGRRPGRDIPAVYVEHNAPQGRINELRHPAADRRDLVVAHVTFFNQLFWDCGRTATTVIEHGVVDPGPRYTGELVHAAVVINEPVRRARVTGTDLLDPIRLMSGVPIDLYGMKSEPLGGVDLPQARLHEEMARRRLYLHPMRWTSLGLTLIEAMHLGMPVVALATTEAHEAVPPDAGVVSNRLDVLAEAVRRFANDDEEATVHGKAARAWALSRYGLGRFLHDWDRLLMEVTAR